MPASLILAVSNSSPRARRKIFSWIFDTLAAMTQDLGSWTFMNYGYADLDGKAVVLRLEARDEPERYCIQLYHHAAAGVEFQDKDVVEVSCGRGGGAAYITRYLKPRSVTGIDLSARQIEFCRRVHRLPGLRFLQGEAENIPLPDECADVIVNIEASCLYADTDKFFSEVNRILRPGGHFIYADIHLTKDVDQLLGKLRRTGLQILNLEDITENVAHALEADHQRRIDALRTFAPFFLRGLLKAFAGTKGTLVPNGLANGRMVYLSFVLSRDVQFHKADDAAASDGRPIAVGQSRSASLANLSALQGAATE